MCCQKRRISYNTLKRKSETFICEEQGTFNNVKKRPVHNHESEMDVVSDEENKVEEEESNKEEEVEEEEEEESGEEKEKVMKVV